MDRFDVVGQTTVDNILIHYLGKHLRITRAS